MIAASLLLIISEPFDGTNSILYAMKLFIMTSVNCYGKKGIQNGNCIFAASTESLESQCKVFLKIL